jgi:probable HAF family extracellular repeat protein
MKSLKVASLTALALFAAMAVPLPLSAQHTHYKLIDLGTLGGPQSHGDGGHGAANINNRGTAAGVADTNTPDPFYPNFNPLLSNLIGPYPFVYHAFTTRGGAIVDLGGLPGGNGVASFIAENGWVSGESLNGEIDPLTGWPEENAVLWKDGHIINLGTLGGHESAAGRFNSRGQVAGYSGNAIPDSYSLLGLGTETRAFLWDEESGMQDIGTLGGPDAFAFAVNERGKVVGFSYPNLVPSFNCPFPLTTGGFVWEKNKGMTDLGTLGGTCTLPGAMNNRGQVIGQSNLAGDVIIHPFLWTAPRRMHDLGTLGGSFGFASAINEAGEVVGQATTASDQAFHAFLWRRGVITDLGTLANIDDSCIGAFGVNARGQIVGQAVENFCNGPGQRAFLWQNGKMIDLNVFVPPGSDLTLADVEEINDNGEMFGSALLPNGDARAFLLIPCGEGEAGCVDGAQVATAAQTNPAPAITSSTRSPQGRSMPSGTVAAWRARMMRRHHIPGAATPKD